MSKIRLLLFFRGVAAQQGIASSHTGHRHSDNRWPRPRNTLTPKTGTAASRITIRLLDKKAAPDHVVKPPARHELGIREISPNIQKRAANNKQPIRCRSTRPPHNKTPQQSNRSITVNT